MIRKPVVIPTLVLAISITLLISGGVALWNAGVVADENNLVANFHAPLWFMFGAGLIGFLVSLPWLLGMVAATKRLRKKR